MSPFYTGSDISSRVMNPFILMTLIRAPRKQTNTGSWEINQDRERDVYFMLGIISFKIVGKEFNNDRNAML